MYYRVKVDSVSSQDAGKLGSLEANTTMVVPVRVIIDEAKKQRFIDKHGSISKRSNPLVNANYVS